MNSHTWTQNRIKMSPLYSTVKNSTPWYGIALAASRIWCSVATFQGENHWATLTHIRVSQASVRHTVIQSCKTIFLSCRINSQIRQLFLITKLYLSKRGNIKKSRLEFKRFFLLQNFYVEERINYKSRESNIFFLPV